MGLEPIVDNSGKLFVDDRCRPLRLQLDGNGQPLLDEFGEWVKDACGTLMATQKAIYATGTDALDFTSDARFARLKHTMDDREIPSDAIRLDYDIPEHKRLIHEFILLKGTSSPPATLAAEVKQLEEVLMGQARAYGGPRGLAASDDAQQKKIERDKLQCSITQKRAQWKIKTVMKVTFPVF